MFTSLISWILCIGNNYFFEIFLKNIDLYSIIFKFERLLESPNYYYFGKENFKNIPDDNKLYLQLLNFLNENNIFENGVVLSLSGGVDSMVILALLLKIRETKKLDICSVMINYNLRDESIDEAKFIEKYCKENKVKFYIFNMIENNMHQEKDRKNMMSKERKVFEEKSKELRYSFYQKIINDFDYSGVILGHHKDDLVENIFTNLLKGHNILDLEVMKEVGVIKNVKIFRPLIAFPKSDILLLAKEYNIPYFKDTTPKWSRRGKMRFEIFPLLDNIFGKSWNQKLKSIGDQSNSLNRTVKTLLSDPWIDNVEWVNEVEFNNGNSSSSKTFLFLLPVRFKDDLFMWYYTIPLLFFKKEVKCIKKKSVEKLFNILNEDFNQNIGSTITLDSGIYATILMKDNQEMISFFKKSC